MEILAEFSVCSDFLAEWKTALICVVVTESIVLKTVVKTVGDFPC